ncbi:hypothetical protein CEE37_06670 [candidate division LCP-89 bacterium B3_LCP]|uniref:Uncharacterized protein n=1 Tax=candidate division LCP-89 bacterium B3_LCP TaxID=2012998 RepID=A0A532V0C1_UNCL8|nr:MAG: hypothetical protein CEE37_06670 [candidate division LCP-89 bacterium B3_LCP]
MKRTVILSIILTLSINIAHADWPLFHGDLARTGYSSETTTAGLVELWSVDLGSAVYTSPVVADGEVYLSTTNAQLYAFDQETGVQLWQVPLGSWLDVPPTFHQNKLFFGSNDHKVYCLDAQSGNVLWQAQTGSWVKSSPLVFDGKVFVGSSDHHFYAFDINTGTELFRIPLNGDVITAPSTDGTDVFFAGDDEMIHAITTNGNSLWSVSMGGAVYCAPVCAENKIIYGTIANGEGLSYNRIVALDAANGSQVWMQQLAQYDFLYGTPAVGYGSVYIPDCQGTVHAYDINDGNLIWERSLGDWALQSSPALSNGVLYLGSNDGYIYALDAFTGVVLDQAETDYFIHSSPAVSDGRLYIGSADGTLSAFSLNSPVEIVATPIGTSVSPGETLEFDVTMTELSGQLQNYAAWMRITTPRGGQLNFGNVFNLTLNPYQQRLATGRLNVPPSAPAGDYYLAVNVGSSQDEIWDASSFAFTITTTEAQSGSGDDWYFAFSDALGDFATGPVHPQEFSLQPPFPNPFNPTTNITFSLPHSSDVSLHVYDVSGRHVDTILNESVGAGVHTLVWDATGKSSGVYLFRLQAGDRVYVERGILAK